MFLNFKATKDLNPHISEIISLQGFSHCSSGLWAFWSPTILQRNSARAAYGVQFFWVPTLACPKDQGHSNPSKAMGFPAETKCVEWSWSTLLLERNAILAAEICCPSGFLGSWDSYMFVPKIALPSNPWFCCSKWPTLDEFWVHDSPHPVDLSASPGALPHWLDGWTDPFPPKSQARLLHHPFFLPMSCWYGPKLRGRLWPTFGTISSSNRVEISRGKRFSRARSKERAARLEGDDS